MPYDSKDHLGTECLTQLLEESISIPLSIKLIFDMFKSS